MTTIDFTPAARRLVDLLAGVTDAQLTDRTPCDEFTVADLINHIDGFATGFTAAARKDIGPATSAAPAASPHLSPAWRTTVPAKLDTLAESWAKPNAWEGITQAGGVDLDAAIMGRFALDE